MASSSASPQFRRRLLSWGNIRKYLRYCRSYGIGAATRLALGKIRYPLVWPEVVESIPPSFLDDDSEVDRRCIEKRVSVVIPTHNAGDELGFLIRKLKNQNGIKEIEVVVVDSGSCDQTVELARRHGAKVVSIPAGSFTHSFSRNVGAENATGDYLLFTVQDSLPLTDSWLCELVQALEQNHVAAVSCAEYPRADCDLFYSFLLWNHYHSLQFDRDRILQWNSSCASPAMLRTNAQLSGIALLIRRDVFERYKFASAYAEDLDLGIRLLRGGEKTAFLYRTRVIHSHNRPAYYFLKRGYVDARFAAALIPEAAFPMIHNPDRAFADIAALWKKVQCVASVLPDEKSSLSVLQVIEEVKAGLMDGTKGERDEVPQLDDDLDRFIRRLVPHDISEYKSTENMIVPHVLQHLDQLQEFLSQIHEQLDGDVESQLRAAIPKIFALHAGSHLAYLYLAQRKKTATGARIDAIDKELIAAV